MYREVSGFFFWRISSKNYAIRQFYAKRCRILCRAKRALFAFAQRSGAMKAPVGLSSDRTVLRQQDGGASPRQVRVCKYRNPLRPLRVQIPPFVTCGDIFPRPGEVIPLRGSFMGAFRQLQRARPSRDLRNHYAEISEKIIFPLQK